MAVQRKSRKEEFSNRSRTWTIICVALVCVIALLLRGVIVYQIYPLKYTDEIKQYSAEYAQDPYFVSAVICTESGFNDTAVSNRGAMGLMQIMPDTGAWAAEKIGITEYTADMLNQPDVNIRIGCWYLSYLGDMFDGDMDKVMAGYNAGPNNVIEWAGDGPLTDIPFGETENYLVKVSRNLQIYKGLYDEF
jgi:soluble lytic murein transglycosylase